MIKKLITIISVTVIVIVVAFFIKHYLGGHDKHVSLNAQQNVNHAIEWTPSTRSALIKEMQAITVNYQKLVTSLAQGNWDDVVEKSHAIHSSFILKQELSEEDMHDLHQILPKRFIEMDSRFHDYAKKLAMAAKAKDGELATFYSSKLMDGCISCHQVYAQKRFPGFSKKDETKHGH